MAGFDENIVREYFELNGFFVRQLRKYQVHSRKKRSEEEIDLAVFNPRARLDEPPAFLLFGSEIEKIQRAIVVVKGWHTSRFTPAMLRSSGRALEFLKKDVLQFVELYFGSDSPVLEEEEQADARFTRILVLPGLPNNESHRKESIELLMGYGVDGILTFRALLENILRKVEPNQNYQKSDLLQLLRLLKIYQMVTPSQLELFPEEARR